MEKNIELTGGLFGLIFAAIVSSWQIVIVVTILYGITLFGNLTTGLLYAKQSHSYSQEIARHAVLKKIGMAIGILVLFIVDFIIMGFARTAGVEYNFPVLGSILAGYASAHEIVSMIQNIKKLGNKVPSALEAAANKAEQALDQGRIPDFAEIMKKGS